MKFVSIFLKITFLFTFVKLKISEELFLVHQVKMSSFSHKRIKNDSNGLEKMSYSHFNKLLDTNNEYTKFMNKKNKTKNYNNQTGTNQSTNNNSSISDNSLNISSVKSKEDNNSYFIDKVYYLFDENDAKHFFYAGMYKCNYQACSPPFGACASKYKCRCLDGYANVLKKNENKTICGYKQKLQVIPFVLEAFVFFGLGHIYLGKYVLGIGKFLCLCLIPMITLLFNKNRQNNEISTENEDSGWVMFIFCILCIWYVVDVIYFGFNLYKDINGVPLNAWTL